MHAQEEGSSKGLIPADQSDSTIQILDSNLSVGAGGGARNCRRSVVAFCAIVSYVKEMTALYLHWSAKATLGDVNRA